MSPPSRPRALWSQAFGALLLVGLGIVVAAVVRMHRSPPPLLAAEAPPPRAEPVRPAVAPSPLEEDLPTPSPPGVRPPEADEPAPDLLRGDLVAGIDRVKARAAGCADETPGPGGVLPVRMVVAASGRVVGVKAQGPLAGSAAAACVERAAGSAVFRAGRRPQTIVTWPFVLAATPPPEEPAQR